MTKKKITIKINTEPTSKRVREIMTQLSDGSLKPDPSFQRRKVWKDEDKIYFLQTVLDGYPFPEIYIATDTTKLDLNTGVGLDYIVDGQQRTTTLYEYFTASPTLKLGNGITAYKDLSDQEKTDFLEYKIAIRNLGSVPLDIIKDVFQRINSTSYNLNNIELHNAQYDGAFMQLGLRMSEHRFFDDHRVFNNSDIKRMLDVEYILIIVSTLLSNYFTSNADVGDFLEEFNNKFPDGKKIEAGLLRVISFLESLGLDEKSRAWKKNDLFNLIVELYRALIEKKQKISPIKFKKNIEAFYRKVDSSVLAKGQKDHKDIYSEYKYIVSQGTTSLKNRRRRGEIIEQIIAKSA
jgi:Protein of unknown function DUF262